MANEIKYPYTTGKTLYGVVLNSSGQAWNVSTSVFETITSGDWANYGVALAEQASCGIYTGSFPGAITASGLYNVIIYAKGGSTASPTDTALGVGQISWSGAAEASVLSGTTVNGYASGEDPATLLKADSRFKNLLAYVDCNYTYNPETGVMTLYDINGTTVLLSIQLAFDAAGDITSRIVTVG
jgi:hypothetical protein